MSRRNPQPGRLVARAVTIALGFLVLWLLVSALRHVAGAVSGSHTTAADAGNVASVAPTSSAATPDPASGPRSANPTPNQGTVSAGTTSPGATSPATAPDTSGSAVPAAPATSPDGLVRSGQQGTGRFVVAQATAEPSQPGTRLVRYVVRVEEGLPIDPVGAARQVQQVLDDPRGWPGQSAAHFQLVDDQAAAQLVISIAAPPTVDAQCPLNTRGIWSCDDGHHVLINSDRWLYRTPIYHDDTVYRAYMVNHEVGHFLGHGHLRCPGAGRPAPVMMQQSKGLGGCVANAWPTVA